MKLQSQFITKSELENITANSQPINHKTVVEMIRWWIIQVVMQIVEKAFYVF